MAQPDNSGSTPRMTQVEQENLMLISDFHRCAVVWYTH